MSRLTLGRWLQVMASAPETHVLGSAYGLRIYFYSPDQWRSWLGVKFGGFLSGKIFVPVGLSQK